MNRIVRTNAFTSFCTVSECAARRPGRHEQRLRRPGHAEDLGGRSLLFRSYRRRNQAGGLQRRVVGSWKVMISNLSRLEALDTASAGPHARA